MTGTLIIKTLNSGKAYYYVKLSWQDPKTGNRKQKMLGTGLETKGNKRKAEKALRELIDKNKYLEKLPVFCSSGVDPNITILEYGMAWLDDKKIDGIESSTAETYGCRMKHVFSYFGEKETLIREITP